MGDTSKDDRIAAILAGPGRSAPHRDALEKAGEAAVRKISPDAVRADWWFFLYARLYDRYPNETDGQIKRRVSNVLTGLLELVADVEGDVEDAVIQHLQDRGKAGNDPDRLPPAGPALALFAGVASVAME